VVQSEAIVDTGDARDGFPRIDDGLPALVCSDLLRPPELGALPASPVRERMMCARTRRANISKALKIVGASVEPVLNSQESREARPGLDCPAAWATP
jgi:hypothetical protein